MSVSSVSSPMRMSGIVSGMDTDQMVESLMNVEKMKVDRLVQEKTTLEWEQDVRKELNDRISEFRNNTMSALSPETNLNSAKAFEVYTVQSLDASGTVAVTAGPGAQTGSYTLDVTQIATGATASGTLSFADLDRSLTLEDPASGLGITFVDGEASFRINDETFTFSADTTIDQMMDTVNASDAGVTMRYSELTGTFSIVTDETGSAVSMELEDLSGTLLSSLTLAPEGATGTSTGEDAVLTINGIPVTRDANVFTIDGVQYRLVAETAVPLTFTIEQDHEATIDRVRNFVDQYNKLIDSLQEKLNEKSYREYPPLTEAQRAEMSESEITAWEQYAKSGLVRNDRNLSNLISQMRSMIFETVDGTGANLATIGITTGSYLEKGKLYLDEDALKQALTDDPENVMKLFMQDSDSDDATVQYNESGLLERLKNAFTKFSALNYKPAEYAQEMIDYNERIQRMNELLTEKENNYYRQFSAMEEALSTLYAQSEWLSSMLYSE